MPGIDSRRPCRRGGFGNNYSSHKAFPCVEDFCNVVPMLSTSGKFRWIVHLLCGWCLLATHGDVSPVSHSTHCSHIVELAAAIAPTAADFSDTALQQNCQSLVKADQQVRAYARKVGLLASTGFPTRYGQPASFDAQLPCSASLFTLGVALRL